ncbi:UDP-N-acetylmuramoyl-L-alanyl-D-glutamate--2,6-diaminopimelate ligase [Flavobacterium sp. Fl-77]|uniref:UDP-N-acetylmuramoyl-L-alanyl-D-glutamate--2,6-diaminopimelate ligase n=1 Tax=Flavobacterium flavipigmentatum TaxID=2893884 RepID=A0AAJ2SE24_9FLAO|nr:MULTISPECIES: UDP-N-acetylmuramoyl-L-alanyl-D-glutamate--2,6-diaminopimelate ligase [unclassified Flavobacterium]MDX6183812.1 UDP-N-acetylmuramoyl-L-alanyl-D-glutamate--2,6-diaminopimelate ligase [Flavobacterium sp. Fl-33]MDX6187444.1 UDP-N-acetylmuramoyl-L-alanyl-D-glutamate--2,6-diaminopimelate ligase [Flavobacterium sp. Fl-77]UFH40346.1 UDP-N-acetylmuramoyl-L-alanyl-D-glutamate--2,6-diaminopimelate ligase [Flavobacterium sp. F-70]
MKILKDILYKVAIESVTGSTDIAIHKIDFDSRKIEENDLFVAIRGSLSDGHDFIEKAIQLGATAIICDTLPEKLEKGITYIKVQDTNAALAFMAANFFENPSEKLKLVGVTGTNGKTTIASLLFQLFENAGFKVGLLSTVKIMVDKIEYKATHTTPDSITINYYLNEMVKAGVTHCFMEVSSHGIHQKRTEALHFVGGIFTNLSHDHLDYHPTFAEYRDVKKSFFDSLPKTAFALSNSDDKNGAVMLQNTVARKRTYALKTYADFKAIILESQMSGLLLKVNENEVWVKLIGTFNAYNVLAIYGTAIELGMDSLEALRLLSDLESVSGRFQYIISESNITAIVDYAHTPDALENVLKTIEDVRTKNEQLITVVGCGGNRDKTKRPIMSKIATDLSDKAILTSDNPRNENPEVILDEMEMGVEPQNYKKMLRITDRKQAIKTACQLAQSNDIILIAGKGHETYQEVNGVRHHFDDMETVKEILEQLGK